MYLVIFYLNVLLLYILGMFSKKLLVVLVFIVCKALYYRVNMGHLGSCLYISIFHRSFFMFLHLFICFRVFIRCLFVISLGSFITLLAIINSSIFFIYSSLQIIKRVFPLSAFVTIRWLFSIFWSYIFMVFHSHFSLSILLFLFLICSCLIVSVNCLLLVDAYSFVLLQGVVLFLFLPTLQVFVTSSWVYDAGCFLSLYLVVPFHLP
jgi:hypothetical protein